MSNIKKFLLTGFYLNGYHGSMMHILELAEELIRLGYEVSIAACKIDEVIKKQIEQNVRAKVYFFEDLPLEVTYDYVLSYHDPILTYLITKGLKFEHLGVGALSSFLDIEQPSIFSLQGFPVLVHSQELADKLKKNLNIFNVKIIPNSVPLAFSNTQYINTILKKIAIISNHIPEELLEAKNLLEQEGYHVTIYGKGYNYKKITPEIIKEYDAIVSIGKTVQYALAMGVPLYNYDIWGGSGYITPENLDIAEYYNFSGRDNKTKKTAEEIKKEIIMMHPICLKNNEILKDEAKKRYDIESQTKYIIEILDSTSNHLLETPELILYQARCRQHCQDLIHSRELISNIYPHLEKLLFVYKLFNKLTFRKCFKNIIKNLEYILDIAKLNL